MTGDTPQGDILRIHTFILPKSEPYLSLKTTKLIFLKTGAK